MKILKINSFIAAALLAFVSCADYVDVVPDNIATIDYAFRDRVGAEKFLATCYSFIPRIGDPKNDPALMGSDEFWNYVNTQEASSAVGNYEAFYIKTGLQNAASPRINAWDGENYGGKGLYKGIRNCNIFLERVDNVNVQVSAEQRSVWKAEVKVLKAYFHFYLMRMYGPIPLVKENLSVEGTPEEVRVYRDSWDDCVDYTVSLIDEAVEDLPLAIENRATEAGHITKPAALAIKAMILTTSASPLFNGNPDYVNLVDNRGVHIFTQAYDASKWKRAADACLEAIKCAEEAGHRLYSFPTNQYIVTPAVKLVNDIRCAYHDSYNEEMLWCNPQNDISSNYEYYTMPIFRDEAWSTNPYKPFIGPSFSVVEKFYSINGVPIDEDNSWAYADRYKMATADDAQPEYVQTGYHTAGLNLHREPRFYANICFDGCYWWGNGNFTGAGWDIHMKRGQTSGKNSNVRYTVTGYMCKKPNHYTSTTTSTWGRQRTAYTPALIRLADIYLLYAECLNETLETPNEEVYKYVDLVRQRAGLKGVVESWEKYSRVANKPKTKEGMREIIHRERDLELCFESKHFWDVRRWKTAMSEIPGPVYGWNVDASKDTEYYNIITLANLSFTTKEYLWPIKTNSIRTNTNLVQNPYWE